MSVRVVALVALAGLSLRAQENAVSLDREVALGKQLAAEVGRQTAPIDSPLIQDYVAGLGKKIAAQIPEAKVAFTFTVIGNDFCDGIHEPIALPGGCLYIPASLFVAAQDEAEFAGMLAHAMEHVAQRDWTRTNADIGTVPILYLGSWGIGRCPGGLLMPVTSLKSQRATELKADVLAVQTMARAGYDPNALVRYVERVQVQPAPGTVPKMFSSIPERSQRVAGLRAAISDLPKVDYAVVPPDEFAGVREEVIRLTAPPVPAEGAPSLLRKKLP